jgi:hypothetical protein
VPELGTPFFQDGDGVGGEGRQRGILGRRRRAEHEVLRQFLDIADISLGNDHPAQAPAGHLEIFGEAVDDPDVVAGGAGGWRRDFVSQAVVNLVHQKCPCFSRQTAASASISARVSSVPVGLAGEATSRPAVFVPVLAQHGRRRLEIAVRADRHADRAAIGTQDVAVAGIAGVGQQPFVARVGQGGKGQVQRPGSAIGDGDAAGRHGYAIALT